MYDIILLSAEKNVFTTIVEGFQSVLDFLETVWNLITSLWDGLLTAVTALYSSAPVTYSLIVLMPSVVSGCMILVTLLAVVKFIIGRDNS